MPQTSSIPKVRPVVRIAAAVLVAVVCLVLVEAAARAYWWRQHGLKFFDTRADPVAFYPNLRSVLRAAPSRRDTTIDVLLLGASTIYRDFGSIQLSLQEAITGATHRPVRVFNLGLPAHTSRDSYFKYRALAAARFDLVILYDGFNEVRANNVAPEMFRDDYGHFWWYDLRTEILDHDRLWPFATPFTISHAMAVLRDRLAKTPESRAHVPRERPDSALTRFGENVRTAGPFRKNVEAVLDMAEQRGDPAIIMTFAADFVAGYSEEAFKARKLPYTLHLFPIELWGRPPFVAAALAAHNDAIRAIHAARPQVGFVDLDASFPRDAEHFNDVCHFTVRGSQRWVEMVLPAALAAIKPPEVDSTTASRK